MCAQPLFPILSATKKPPATPKPADSSWLTNNSFKQAILGLSPNVSESAPPPPPAPAPSSSQAPPTSDKKKGRKSAADYFDTSDSDMEVNPENYHDDDPNKLALIPLDQRMDLIGIDPVILKDITEEDDDKKRVKKHKKHKKEKHKKSKHKKRKSGHSDSEEEDKKKRKRTDKEKLIEMAAKGVLVARTAATNFWLTAEKLQEGKRFFFDEKGDPNNLVYGSIYKMDLPRYVRSRHCIGVGPMLRVRFVKDGFVVFDPRFATSYDHPRQKGQSRYWTGPKSTKRVTVSKNKDKATTEFIPLQPPQKPPTEKVDDESDSEGETYEDYLYQKTKDFNEQSRDPAKMKDVKFWLSFIEFQDQSGDFSKARPAAILEKKLSIYEKALENIPKSEELLVGYLQTAEKLFEADKTMKLWEGTVSDHPNSFQLWKHYLNFCLSNFTTFTVSNMRSKYGDAISSLQTAKKKAIRVDPSKAEELDLQLLGLFYAACTMEKKSGYIEKAIGSFQALVEFNCFCPAGMRSADFETKWSFFETFWDSQAPRIGDKGALGWANWQLAAENGATDAPTTGDSPPPPPSSPAPPPPPDDVIQDPRMATLVDWMKREQNAEKRWLPLRTTGGVDDGDGGDDDDSDDPERVVLSDDVYTYLFDIASQTAKETAVLYFLTFLGVEHPCLKVSTDDSFHRDRMHEREHVGHLLDLATASDKINYKPPTKLLDPVTASFTRNVLNKAMEYFPDSDRLAVAYIYFEAAQDLNKARNFARNYLQKHTTSIQVVEGYAKVEEPTKTDRIYQATLTSYGALPALPLFHAYAANLIHTKPNLALYILVSAAEEAFTAPPKSGPPAIPAPRLVKTRKIYEDRLAEISKKESAELAMHWGGCYGMLEYLTRGLDHAITAYEHALSFLKEGTYPHETLAVEYVKLVYRHVVNHPTPPPKFRRICYLMLAAYPANTLFLSLFIESETRSQIDNRLRRYFDHACQEMKGSAVEWLYAIQIEAGKLGAANRIRSLYEKAIASPVTTNCVMLWRAYIQFELSNHNFKSAKQIYYRAVRQIPYSKRLWLDSIQHLRQCFTPDELHDMIQLVNEKEIRIRAPFEL